MAGRYYFLLSALPEVTALGETPPMDLAEFRRRVAEEEAAAGLIDAVLLAGDLTLREAGLAGEIERPEPVVLSAGQLAGEEPLPEFLAAEPARRFRVGADAAWEAYYRHAAALAAGRCPFICRWVGFEVALRNALAVARAKALQIDPGEYLLAEDLADGEAPVGEVVAAWSAAPDPLAALRTVDEARWKWTEENSPHFSFQIDELAAYAVRLVLAARWQVLTAAARKGAGATSGTS